MTIDTEQDQTFQLIKTRVMPNASRNMLGRGHIASVPVSTPAQEPTFVDTYRIIDGEVTPVLSAAGAGAESTQVISTLLRSVDKDVTVVTTTIKTSPDAITGKRVVIGMSADARPIVGAVDTETIFNVNGTYSTHHGTEISAMDFNDLPARLRDWVAYLSTQHGDTDSTLAALESLEDDSVGVFVYGQGPLAQTGASLDARGFMGTDAGSFINVDPQTPARLKDLMIALLSVLTPDEQYVHVAQQFTLPNPNN